MVTHVYVQVISVRVRHKNSRGPTLPEISYTSTEIFTRNREILLKSQKSEIWNLIFDPIIPYFTSVHYKNTNLGTCMHHYPAPMARAMAVSGSARRCLALGPAALREASYYQEAIILNLK